MREFHLESCGVYNTENFFSSRRKTKTRVCSLFEVEYYIGCSGHAFIDGRDYPLLPDTILLGKPGAERASIPHFLCYYLHFTVDEESHYAQALAAAPDYFSNIHAETYRGIFRDIVRHTLRDENNTASDYTYAKMLELFCLLLRDASKNAVYTPPDKRSGGNLVTETVNYLHSHLQERITLRTLSQVFRYSPNYIEYLFTKTMGETPQRYLEQIRLEKAKMLLVEQNYPISDIAYLCGFSSQSYFSLCFRRAFGIPPKQWKLQESQDPFLLSE